MINLVLLQCGAYLPRWLCVTRYESKHTNLTTVIRKVSRGPTVNSRLLERMTSAAVSFSLRSYGGFMISVAIKNSIHLPHSVVDDVLSRFGWVIVQRWLIFVQTYTLLTFIRSFGRNGPWSVTNANILGNFVGFRSEHVGFTSARCIRRGVQ